MDKLLRFEELVRSMPWANFEEIYRRLREECRSEQEKWSLDTDRYNLLQIFLLCRNEERIECSACGGFHYVDECEVEYREEVSIYKAPCGAVLKVREREVYICSVCFKPSEGFEYEFDDETANLRVRLSCGHIVDELSRNLFFRKEVNLLNYEGEEPQEGSPY